MAMDVPVTVYDYKEKAPTRKGMDNVADKWAKNHKDSLVGKTVSLNDILSGKDY